MPQSFDETRLPKRNRPRLIVGVDGDTLLPPADAAGIHIPGEVIDDRYAVLREIGRGGMGVVYEVEDHRTKTRYAVKRLLPEYSKNPRITAAFVREGTAAETFSADSPYFVTTKAVGHDFHGFYVLMELISAPTLRSLLSNTPSNQLPVAQSIAVIEGLAAAMNELHFAEYVHRDLKPENIFVFDGTYRTRVKLVDFGLTREFRESTQSIFSGAGSFRYMAPELFREESATSRSDVYSFGVVSYELLTGVLPTGGDKISDYRTDVPIVLENLIVTCLSGRPERRPRNGILLCEQLKQLRLTTPPRLTTFVTEAAPEVIAARVSLNLVGVPTEANVTINGQLFDGQLYTEVITQPFKTLLVRVDASGFQPFSRTVRIKSGDSATLVVNLEKPSRFFGKLNEYVALDRYMSELCTLPAGNIYIGSNLESREKPRHKVSLSSFRMGATPVTVDIWKEYCRATGQEMPMEPLWGWIDDHPMVNVSWFDIMGFDEVTGFCGWASQVTGQRVTLPTEAQFEYASCSGRSTNMYPWGSDFDNYKLWCSQSTYGDAASTVSVRRQHNIYVTKYGLSDMMGNVWQWCYDWYGRYTPGQKYNPIGQLHSSMKRRCVRGGSWYNFDTSKFRNAHRYSNTPDIQYKNYGFRIVVNYE